MIARVWQTAELSILLAALEIPTFSVGARGSKKRADSPAV
jgi:hypothetical protein